MMAGANPGTQDGRPLIAHVVYRLAVGGLENGLVNIVNHMPRAAYRHVIISLTDITDFGQRIARDDVELIALAKPPGHGVRLYPKLFELFRGLKPAIVHSRNLAALEVTVPAYAAGVPVRIHGEHGRDVGDLDGTNRKYQWVRRAYRPFVTHYIALSRDLERYLTQQIGVPARRVSQIYNGVDTGLFRPAAHGRDTIPGSPFVDPALWLVGTVGRLATVKAQLDLVQAFLRALELAPAQRSRLRLVVVGEGPLRAQALAMLEAAGHADLAWLPGERGDIPAVLRGLDCFVLPSLAEGISNTILEAMATGLPVIATSVGGNPELVDVQRYGRLVEARDVEAMAGAIVEYATHRERAALEGREARARVELQFSLEAMVRSYQALYDSLLARHASHPRAAAA